jgi:hypothetical protein
MILSVLLTSTIRTLTLRKIYCEGVGSEVRSQVITGSESGAFFRHVHQSAEFTFCVSTLCLTFEFHLERLAIFAST